MIAPVQTLIRSGGRPLFEKKLPELLKIFDHSRAAPERLAELLFELKHRKTWKALQLRTEVEKALTACAAIALAPTPVVQSTTPHKPHESPQKAKRVRARRSKRFRGSPRQYVMQSNARLRQGISVAGSKNGEQLPTAESLSATRRWTFESREMKLSESIKEQHWHPENSRIWTLIVRMGLRLFRLIAI